VNAETLKILEDVAEREPPSGTALTERLWELAKEIKRSPGDPSAEEVIRILRDSGEEALERRLRGDRD
jgi:hypothetical protein